MEESSINGENLRSLLHDGVKNAGDEENREAGGESNGWDVKKSISNAHVDGSRRNSRAS